MLKTLLSLASILALILFFSGISTSTSAEKPPSSAIRKENMGHIGKTSLDIIDKYGDPDKKTSCSIKIKGKGKETAYSGVGLFYHSSDKGSSLVSGAFCLLKGIVVSEKTFLRESDESFAVERQKETIDYDLIKLLMESGLELKEKNIPTKGEFDI